MTPTETRHRLAVLRDRAIAAGLVSLVQRVDIQLGIAAQIAIGDLEKALADAQPLDAAHASIVQQLDTPPEVPPTAIPAPRRPGIAAPANSPRPAPKPAPRRFTGPDRYDSEIPV